MMKSFGMALALLLLGMDNIFAAEEGACGNQVVFFTTIGGLLWRSDGTTAGTHVIPVNGMASDFGPGYFTQFGTKVLFGMPHSYRHRRGLWQTDGTTAGTTEIQVNDSHASGLNPTELIRVTDKIWHHDKVLFKGHYKDGQYYLWETDGTTAGTKVVTGVNQSTAGVFREIYKAFFAELNGSILFRGVNASDKYGLWVTPGGFITAELPAFQAPPNFEPIYLTHLNGKVLFGALGGLWETDGTSAGTKSIPVSNASPSGLLPSDFGSFEGELLFRGRNALGNLGLWKTDGTSAGTREIHVNGASSDFQPGGFTSLSGVSIFYGKNAAGRRSLWRTDGTQAGTVEIAVPARYEFGAALFAPFKGYLVFAGNDGTNTGTGLWRTDGTLAGTVPIPVNGHSSPGDPQLNIIDLASVRPGSC
jgi:ELWxxDGT repeat protein